VWVIFGAISITESGRMKKYWILVILWIIGLTISVINPHDYFTWILEVFPSIIGLLVLIFTFRSFRFTYFVYVFILVHCYILFIGGHYTYAEVPFFNWIKDLFHQSRNNYDKLGHFVQGFIPALIVRELFIRLAIVRKGWVSFLTVCVCLSISVLYEFLEWSVAVASGQSADAFLGTQGYTWDTQSDMLWALIGAVCMVVFLSRIHDKQINKVRTVSLGMKE
jgi:putative membrane protein